MSTAQVILKIGAASKIAMVVFGIFSFGVVPLIVSSITKKTWPKVLDRNGLTLRNGERLLWSDLTDVRREQISGGLLLTVRPIRLAFGKKVAVIVPRTLANRREVLAFLQEVLGQQL